MSVRYSRVRSLGTDDLLPVPLVDVGGVVVVEEVVLADRLHVGADSLAGLHAELTESNALPLRCRLDDLPLDGIHVSIVADVELDRASRSVTVEVVVDAAGFIHNERYLHHHQPEFATEVLFDVRLDGKQRLHGFAVAQCGRVVIGQILRQILVVSNTGPGKVGGFVSHGTRLLQSSLRSTRTVSIGPGAI